MTIIGHLNSLNEIKLRGIRVQVPKPPNEFAERNYLEHRPLEKFLPTSKHSIEKSSTNLIDNARRNPIPPFAGATKSLIPPQGPHMTPSRTTMKLTMPRRTTPAVRDANSMTFSPTRSAHSVFFQDTTSENQSALNSYSGSIPRLPRCGLNSAPTSDIASLTVAGGIFASRSPRYTATKCVRSPEGSLVVHPECSQREERALSRSPRRMEERRRVSDVANAPPSLYNFRKTPQDAHYELLQHDFEDTMHSPRSVVLDLGLHDLRLAQQRRKSVSVKASS